MYHDVAVLPLNREGDTFYAYRNNRHPQTEDRNGPSPEETPTNTGLAEIPTRGHTRSIPNVVPKEIMETAQTGDTNGPSPVGKLLMN